MVAGGPFVVKIIELEATHVLFLQLIHNAKRLEME